MSPHPHPTNRLCAEEEEQHAQHAHTAVTTMDPTLSEDALHEELLSGDPTKQVCSFFFCS